MKIKKIYIKLFSVITLLLLTTIVKAGEDVTFTASTKPVVEVGERFQITYTVNADGENFKIPDFGSLSVLSGPNRSSSSSIQFINGNMTRSTELSYTFLVMATSEGKVNIPPATITVNGKVYKSNPLTITIVKSNTATHSSNNKNANRSSSGNVGSKGSSTVSENGLLKSNDLYIKAFISKKNPYLGEQVIVTYKIYTKVPVSDLTVKKLSSFPGFWTKDLMGNNKQLKQSRKIINGEEYVVADIRQLALFPQKTGKIKIEPLELECTAQIRVKTKRRRSYDPFEDFFNDPFFNNSVKNVKTVLKSNPLTIDVKPLPEANKPANFNGAVGNFSFSAKIDRTKLKANEALTITLTISGTGNLELIEPPKIDFPPDFETYDPKVTTRVKTNSNGVSGYKKIEYLAIPRNPGDFKINPVKFSFFNPKEKKYYSYSSEEYNIHVEKGSGSSASVVYSSSAQEDIHYIGKDIHHIKTIKVEWVKKNDFLFGSKLFLLLLVLPLILLLLAFIIKKVHEKRINNSDLIRNKKANKIAKTRLHKASKLRKEGKDKEFYDEIAQALWGYISDKFDISQAELSIDSVKEKLTELNVDDNVTSNFINTLNDIEFARFAPGDVRDKMENIYNEAMNAIMQAEKALKK
jgi:uncharacterized membrane protein